ncbi:hypothetical protein QA612_14235 [Evansella sp. AB-P1]|uniref:hypothetical protein n=1 Tax=Evansella sp. AB-P1 TaxID=3037653 RepID=UPI00241E1B74|nr:hypothetical protein [Evansella sp. AB-P1]MDG5788637.1 hypothetical protein [Evansella sp. AB-P1]
MYKWFLGCIVIFILFLAGCNSSELDNREGPSDFDELANFEVLQPMDETKKGNFIFRLISEKEEYKEGEEVKLYGELEYVGRNEEVTITHSDPVIVFPLEDKMRGFSTRFGRDDDASPTTLKQGEPYRQDYKTMFVYNPIEDSEEYLEFLEQLDEHFPAGYYVVNGQAIFNHGIFGNETVIKAQIDFKVVP